jgi:hypothetical protein
MKHVNRIAIVALSALLVAGCAADVTEEDLAALQQQLDAERERAVLLEGEAADLKTQLQQATADAEADADADIHVLQAARGNVELPPPPAPPPAGAPAPPPPPQPGAEYFERAGEFAFYVEPLTASGVSEFGYQYEAGCVLNNNFKRGSKMVWRVEVIDLATGQRVMPDDAELHVALPHGEDRNMRFGQRGGGRVEGAPFMWVTSWNIPPDYPVGSLDFAVVVNHNDGRSQTWRMPYSGTQLQIIDHLGDDA